MEANLLISFEQFRLLLRNSKVLESWRFQFFYQSDVSLISSSASLGSFTEFHLWCYFPVLHNLLLFNRIFVFIQVFVFLYVEIAENLWSPRTSTDWQDFFSLISKTKTSHLIIFKCFTNSQGSFYVLFSYPDSCLYMSLFSVCSVLSHFFFKLSMDYFPTESYLLLYICFAVWYICLCGLLFYVFPLIVVIFSYIQL